MICKRQSDWCLFSRIALIWIIFLRDRVDNRKLDVLLVEITSMVLHCDRWGILSDRQKIAFLPYCVCRGDHWSPANLPQQRIFWDSFLTRQTGAGEQCSPLQEFFDSLILWEMHPDGAGFFDCIESIRERLKKTIILLIHVVYKCLLC